MVKKIIEPIYTKEQLEKLINIYSCRKIDLENIDIKGKKKICLFTCVKLFLQICLNICGIYLVSIFILEKHMLRIITGLTMEKDCNGNYEFITLYFFLLIAILNFIFNKIALKIKIIFLDIYIN